MSGWFVTENDISNWTATNKRRAEELLPLLVKKLIQASSNPKTIDFPSGDAVAIGGWDGLLEVENGNGFIPEGISGWELGTNSNVKSKADEDYQKRSNDSGTLDKSESSYVFVTSRLWTKKDEWVRGKNAESIWKNVVGVNASVLCEWMEQCPAVHRWFAQIIGKRDSEARDINQAWEGFSNSTKKKLTPEFFLHGRDEEVEKITDFLKQESGAFNVFSYSRAEAIGFILSTLFSDDVYSNKALIIKSLESWDFIVDSYSQLILVPYGFKPSNIGFATSKNHLVINIDDQYSKSPDLTLNRQQRIIREQAISKLGFSESEAGDLYQDTRGYIEPLLRHELLEPIDQIAIQWLDKYEPEILFTSLFASNWRDDNENDRKIIEVLSGKSYEEFKKQVLLLSNESDPPIRLIRNNWQVISKLDFWFLIALKITDEYIQRLGKVTPVIFSDFDPAYDLEPDERYMANINGEVPKHSGTLKNGIADTLALLATLGDDPKLPLSNSVSALISYWLRTLFEENTDVRFWFSLGSATRSFAEASPVEFLEAVFKASQGKHSELQKLFEAETSSSLGGGTYHANLLWALEITSWNKLALAQVSSCLARLTEVDLKESNYMNRPINSLKDIFLGWVNNSSASHDERLQVLEYVLISQYSNVSWKLMMKLLHNSHEMTSGVMKPKYRDWALNVEKSTTNKKYYEYVGSIVDLLLNELDKDIANRILDLTEHFDSYTKEQIDLILNKFESIDESTLDDTQKTKIIDKLRNTISHHREFPDTKWSWEENLIKRLEFIYLKFNFTDLVKKNKFLFDSYDPDLIEPLNKKEFDYNARNKLLERKRKEAVESIFDSSGIEGIIQLIEISEYPDIIGGSAYSSSKGKVLQDYALDWINEEGDKKYFASRFLNNLAFEDFEKAKKIYFESSKWDSDTKASFLLCLPVKDEVFDLIDDLPEPSQVLFWLQFNKHFYAEEITLTLRIIESLSKYDRPLAAIDVMGGVIYKKKDIDLVEPSLVVNLLKQSINNPADLDRVGFNNISHDILKCIEFIQDSDIVSDQDLIFIEWQFLNLFKYRDGEPKTLFKAVSEDASFFAQLVSWVFKRSDGKDDLAERISEEQKSNRAHSAWKLLDLISILPGQNGDEIDKDRLDEWVSNALVKLKELGREDIGYDQIGQYLSCSINGKDDLWPHESVRFIIEKYKNRKLEQAIIIGKKNSRGITTRHPHSGGHLERDLVKKYSDAARSMQLVYPKTSGLLMQISKEYEYDAKRHDEDVELG